MSSCTNRKPPHWGGFLVVIGGVPRPDAGDFGLGPKVAKGPPRGYPLATPFSEVPLLPRSFISGTRSARREAFAPLGRYIVLICQSVPLLWSALFVFHVSLIRFIKIHFFGSIQGSLQLFPHFV